MLLEVVVMFKVQWRIEYVLAGENLVGCLYVGEFYHWSCKVVYINLVEVWLTMVWMLGDKEGWHKTNAGSRNEKD